MRKRILFSFIGLTLITLFVLNASASWVLVPNGSFESGTVGLIPNNWVMITANSTDPPDAPKTATFIHEMKQTDQKYFEGVRSLWLHSRVVDEGLRIGRGSCTTAETADWINAPEATRVRIYIRDIKSTHSDLWWGWGNSILLFVNNVSVSKTYWEGGYYDWIFIHDEFVNWNHYNYTATGADGQSWYVYDYSIPESVDKTHMKIEIVCWAWDWTFYSTSYFSDLEFVVDKVELLLAPPPPLSVSISPLSTSIYMGQSVSFTSTASGGTPPYNYQWYLNNNPVPGATSSGWTFTPTAPGTFTIFLNVTDSLGYSAKSNEATVTVASQLSTSISPTSASILVGQSAIFTSTVSGGYTPYSYQWYLNGAPVSGATSPSWTFTPTTSGIYYVYLKVTDAKANTVQSDTARITVAAVPVGGYSISIQALATAKPLTPCLILTAILTIAFTTIKRKTTRKTKKPR